MTPILFTGSGWYGRKSPDAPLTRVPGSIGMRGENIKIWARHRGYIGVRWVERPVKARYEAVERENDAKDATF